MAPITHIIAPFRGLQCNVRAPVVSEAPTGIRAQHPIRDDTNSMNSAGYNGGARN
jgi:hypothetical protein